MSIFVRRVKAPKLRSPALVGGIPDSGNVAKLAMDYLIAQLNAQPFAEIYSHHLPPYVVVKGGGVAEPVKNQLFYWRHEAGGRDLVLYTGDSQPTTSEGAYQLADKVLEIAQGLGVSTVYSVGANITGRFVEKPRVQGVATHPEALEELRRHGIHVMGEGNVTWMNGLLFGLARLRGMVGVFVSGETSGYVADSNAAKAILEALSRIFNLTIDLSAIEDKAKEVLALSKSIEFQRRRQPSEPPPFYRV